MKRYIGLFIFIIIIISLLTGCKSETMPENAYYLVIGEDNVAEIKISTSTSSGGVVNADGSLFHIGEKVWIEELDGVSSLRGVSITAVNKDGDTVYSFSVPADADEGTITKLVLGDSWLVAPTEVSGN